MNPELIRLIESNEIQIHGDVEYFAELVAAAEREACAKVCEERKSKYEKRASKSEDERDIDPEVAQIAKMTCNFNAAAIRARGEA
jgi:hypothetical protein